MPMLIFTKCVDCKRRLETLDRYYSVGEPFIKCDYCDTYNLIPSHRTEWALRGPVRRTLHWARVVLVGCMVGGGVGLMAAEGMKYLGHDPGSL